MIPYEVARSVGSFGVLEQLMVRSFLDGRPYLSNLYYLTGRAGGSHHGLVLQFLGLSLLLFNQKHTTIVRRCGSGFINLLQVMEHIVVGLVLAWADPLPLNLFEPLNHSCVIGLA